MEFQEDGRPVSQQVYVCRKITPACKQEQLRAGLAHRLCCTFTSTVAEAAVIRQKILSAIHEALIRREDRPLQLVILLWVLPRKPRHTLTYIEYQRAGPQDR